MLYGRRGSYGISTPLAAITGISALATSRIVRFLTGVGEAAVTSNVTRGIASWTSVRERGFAGGLQVCGLGLGGTLTPIFIAWMIIHWGWRASFAVCAVLAFAIVAYVYYNWFYFYAVKMRGLGLMQAAAWTSAPFLAMALLSPVRGWFSDRVAQATDRRTGRRAAVLLGMGLSGVLLYGGNHITLTVIALPMIALAAVFNMFAAANFWATCIDLAPSYSASLSALMNTMGSLGRSRFVKCDGVDRVSSRLEKRIGCSCLGYIRFRPALYHRQCKSCH